MTVDRLSAALVDRYRVERELGAGGMATVYLAEDLKHHRKVAIKVLRPELASVLGADRFLREITTTARLAHPGILPLFDSGTDQGISWYAMPLITGKTLSDRIAEAGSLPLEEALQVFHEIAGALEYAHGQGVLHRDLKPSNILLQNERAVLADFGIALPVENRGDRLTGTGFSMGTPEYMSPEQALGERALDARSDLYSLGCVLYEMLAGQPPFSAPSVPALIARRLTETAPRLGSLRTVPPHLDLAVSRALERDPASRFDTVAAFARAVTGESESGGLTRALPRARSRRPLLMTGSALVLLLAVAAWVITRPRTPSDHAESDHPVDPAAETAYLQARALLGRRTQADLTNAVTLLQRAISIDSSYALAWAGLAEAMGWARSWGYQVEGISTDSLLSRQLAAADRALGLDSTNADMWLMKAAVARAIDPTNLGPTINTLRRLLALDSTNAHGWNSLGWALDETGDREAAVVAMRRGVALGWNPVALANHFYWWREFDSAAVWADSAVVINPRLAWAHETVGAIALAQARLPQARAAYEAAQRLDTGPTQVRALEGLAEVAAREGNVEMARAFIRQAEAVTDSGSPTDHAAISLGSAYAAIGAVERALWWLERYQPRGNLHFQLHLKRDLMLDPLRGLPRFAALMTN